MLPDVEVIETDEGLKYALFKTRDYISTSIRKYGHFDQKIQDLAQSLITTGVVLDIGANLGSFTIPLAKKNPNIKFIAFEPQEVVYRQLTTNVFLNSLDNVECVRTGLGAQPYFVEHGIPDYKTAYNIGGLTLSKRIEELRKDSIKGKLSAVTGKTLYQISTLDQYQISDITLVKIDVEGMEYDVLVGAYETLEKNEFPPILFECWDDDWFSEERQELFNLLTEYGYTIVPLGKNNYLAQK